MAGARLVSPHRDWISPNLLDRWLYRRGRLLQWRIAMPNGWMVGALAAGASPKQLQLFNDGPCAGPGNFESRVTLGG